MKSFALLTAAVAVAFVASAKAEETVHWNGPGVFVVLRNGDTPFALTTNDNKLDKPKTISCRSQNGCIISFAALVFVENTSLVYVCSLIDGAQAHPHCQAGTNSSFLQSRQSIRVARGRHVIQTIVNSSSDRGTVYTWEVDYAIYEK